MYKTHLYLGEKRKRKNEVKDAVDLPFYIQTYTNVPIMMLGTWFYIPNNFTSISSKVHKKSSYIVPSKWRWEIFSHKIEPRF